MVKMISPRFALSLILLSGGYALAAPSVASAHPHPERVKVIPGTVAAKPDRKTRTRIEVFRDAGGVTILRSTNVQNANRELRGGPQGPKLGTTVERATTGRSPETVTNGVRIINLRRNLRAN